MVFCKQKQLGPWKIRAFKFSKSILDAINQLNFPENEISCRIINLGEQLWNEKFLIIVSTFKCENFIM